MSEESEDLFDQLECPAAAALAARFRAGEELTKSDRMALLAHVTDRAREHAEGCPYEADQDLLVDLVPSPTTD